jgi:hypothetical protein
MAVPKATLIDPKTISTTGAPVATLIDPSTVTPGAIAKNTYKEVPLKIRFLVEGAPNMESKIATLKKFYPEVKQIEDSNFLVTDAKGTTHIFDDREKTTIGDFIDASKEITEMIASTVGAIGGSAAGPVGTIAGSGAGLALGAEIFERVAQQFGTEMLRTPEEYAKQRASDFAFGSVGQAVAPIVFKGAKYAITGGAKKVAEAGERLASFINAGVSPSLGQVTFNRAIQTVELALGSIPGSSGYIAKFAQKAQDDFGNTLAKLASKTLADDGILIKGGTMAIPDETVVGQILKRAVSDSDMYTPFNSANSWKGRFDSLTNLLYSKIDDYVPKKTLFTLDNTLSKFKSILSPVAGAEITSKELQNPFIQKISASINKDLKKNGGKMSYQGIKDIRSDIGSRISDISLIGTKEQGLLKQLYGSISSDIETNVLSIGGTKAMNALRRANRVWQAGNKKLEDFLQPIFNKANPDTLVKDLMASAREGSTRLLALKNSFKPEQYKALVSSIIDKMGRISPGQGIAGELGEEVTGQIGRFSSETFLTNWNKLSPAAKETLFSGKGFPKSMVKDLNDLLQVSNVIRESGKTFRNPSGTADRLAGIGIGIGGAVGVVTGNPMFLAAMPLVMFGANVTSKLMTNPRFVSWAAQATKIAGNKGIEGMAEHITKLGAIAASAGPEERQALFEYMGILKEAADKENKIIKPEPPVAKKVSEAPTQPTERQQVASAMPVLDRSMFPSTSTMTNVSTPTTGGQGLASISGNQFKSLFPGDTLGAAYMENKNA